MQNQTYKWLISSSFHNPNPNPTRLAYWTPAAPTQIKIT